MEEADKKPAEETTQKDSVTIEKETTTLSTEEKVDEKKLPKKFYKKPLFWIGIVAAVIGVVSITLGLIYRSNVLSMRKTSSDGWFAITTQAELLVTDSNKLSETLDYTGYSTKLHAFETLVKDQQHKADQLPGFLTDKSGLDRYEGFLSDFNTYIGRAAQLSDKPGEYSQSDNEELENQATTAESATSNFRSNANYVQGNMPEKIFQIPAVLQDSRDALDTTKKQAEANKQAAAAAAAKDSADKKTVTDAVTGFEQGFIAADSAKMRRFMTQGFQNEYNFAQLSPENRQFTYPSTFRIIEVSKNADGSYKAKVNVVYKYTDNPNQYTNGYEYNLIYSSSASTWLINDEKTVNSF